jgi:hypothetical protein
MGVSVAQSSKSSFAKESIEHEGFLGFCRNGEDKTTMRPISFKLGQVLMKLIADKIQIIVLGSTANVAKIGQITVEAGGVIFNSRDTIKSLGLTIDSKLTWIDHINKLSRSYHLTARSLCPLKSVLSKPNFIKVIDACLMSKLSFMSSIWGTANKNTLNILERGMRRTARSIYGLKWWELVRDHITGDLKCMWPKSQYIYNLLCIVFTITSSENHVPFLSHRLVRNNEVHEHHTRRSSSLRVNFTPKCKLSERSLEFFACIKWNELPPSVNLTNIFKFRKTERTYFRYNVVQLFWSLLIDCLLMSCSSAFHLTLSISIHVLF